MSDSCRHLRRPSLVSSRERPTTGSDEGNSSQDHSTRIPELSNPKPAPTKTGEVHLRLYVTKGNWNGDSAHTFNAGRRDPIEFLALNLAWV